MLYNDYSMIDNDTANMIEYIPVEYTPLEEAQGTYSDFYKELHGFRPRSASEEQWNSLEWLNEQIDALHDYAPIVRAEEAEMEKLAVERFETLVAKTIATGAKDRETALRWIMDASDCDGDWEFLCYHHNVPYGYFKKAA